jgi:hypothetical protein
MPADDKTAPTKRAIWVRRWRKLTFGRTDALDAGWDVSGIRVNVALIFYPTCITLILGRRDYTVFWREPKKGTDNAQS